jgi:putative PIN family toxin of toxin-antitoxin system
LRVRRVVPDANVLLGRIVGKEGGLTRRLYLSFRRGDCAFVVSAELLSEIERILSYPKVIALGVTPALAFATAVDLLHLGEYWPSVARYDWPSVSDPKDWYLFDLLFASEADALITQDKGILRAGEALQLPVLHPGELSRLGLP